MQTAAILVCLGMVALASAKLTVPEIAEQLQQMNQLDWKTIESLMNNQNKILADKKVFVDGTEMKDQYILQLMGHLSRINWGTFHLLLSTHTKIIQSQISKDDRKVNVADMLVRTESMSKFNWRYFWNQFAMTSVNTKASSSVSPTKLPASEEKLSESEETTLKIAQMLERVKKIDWVQFDSKTRK